MKVTLRLCSNIYSDLNRGWSSYNFGMWGFNGTYNELMNRYQHATKEKDFFISGLHIHPNDGKEYQFGEFYKNYWVVKDTRNGEGICCVDEFWDSIKEAKRYIEFHEWAGKNNWYMRIEDNPPGDRRTPCDRIGYKIKPSQVIEVVKIKRHDWLDDDWWALLINEYENTTYRTLC